MYFILSKILLFLLLPFNWILALLVIAAFKQDKVKRRRYILAGLSIAYVFSAPVFFKGFTRIWDVKTKAVNAYTKKYSCVIVLGGFSGPDSKGAGRFTWTADRFINGALLLKEGKAEHILITGGNGDLSPGSFREAPWAGLQLKKLGIADSLILIEGNSRNTLENAEFSKKMLAARNLKPPYLLVTSAFHMRRAAMIFQHNGMDVEPYSCSYMTDNSEFGLNDLTPQADILSHWGFYIKEIVGYAVNYFSSH